MAFYYKPISRWTKKRRLQGSLQKALHAIETALSDSDDELNKPIPETSQKCVAEASGDCADVNDSVSVTDDISELLPSDGIAHVSTINTDYFDSADTLSDVSDTVSDISDPDDSVVSELQKWAGDHNVSHAAIGDLLKIVRKRYPELPKDSRTLLLTCGTVQVQSVAGGSYHHFGLVASLTNIIDKYGVCDTDTIIKLQVNIDGLPLFRSSSAQFWPILGLVTNCPVREPFVIGLFYGKSKPTKAAEYLQQFVDEFCGVQHDGFWHNNKQYTVLLSAVVCDMPARAFVKSVKGHTGYHGCDKCIQEGHYTANRMTFPETQAMLRTDESFAARTDVFHHQGPSPFSCLSVGMVSNFPIDYMHSVCLGVMRKLFYFWMKGPLRTRLGGHSVDLISNKLLAVKKCVPSEFARKPRSVSELDRWKATELRQFLLYTGPVCLKGIIPDVMYDNFMLLSVGMFILLSPEHCLELLAQAEVILSNFVDHFGKLYGKEFLTYNVHSVIHLPDEVRTHGALDNVSCFVFENYLGKIKKLLRKPDAPLQQVVKRLSEMSVKTTVPRSSILKKLHDDGPVPKELIHLRQFRQYHQHRFTVSLSAKDSCVLIDGKPAVVRNFLQDKQDHLVVYQSFSELCSFYSYPFQSACLGIYRVSGELQGIEVASVSQITKKCCYLRDGSQHVVIPLLH